MKVTAHFPFLSKRPLGGPAAPGRHGPVGVGGDGGGAGHRPAVLEERPPAARPAVRVPATGGGLQARVLPMWVQR